MLRGKVPKVVATDGESARTRRGCISGCVGAIAAVTTTHGTKLIVTLLLLLAGCMVDDYACSEHQVLSEGQLLTCQCEAGYVLGPEGYGCVACPQNEVVSTTGKCECATGFTRNAMTGVCEVIEGSYAGRPCSASSPCGQPVPYCALSESMPYCTTSGCTVNNDCPMDWQCHHDAGQSFCKTPPTGLGMTCTSSADCEGKEASHCERFVKHVCVVNNCHDNPGICPSQSSCCDMRATLVGQSICVFDSDLANGLCPNGQEPVRP